MSRGLSWLPAWQIRELIGKRELMPKAISRSGGKRVAVLTVSMLTLAGGGAPAAQPAPNDPSKTQAAAPTIKSIGQIRDAIQAANDRDGSGAYEGIIPYLGDKIEAVHEPRFPSDSFVDGKQLAKSLPYEHRVHDAMIENRRMDVTFTVRGDNEIVVRGQLTGKLRYDGSQLVHPVNMVWTFDQGRIVRIWVDASTPAIKDGYRRQHEAMMSPAIHPLYDQWMAAMKAP
jgi:ketosteroid isomerase-like protein